MGGWQGEGATTQHNTITTLCPVSADKPFAPQSDNVPFVVAATVAIEEYS